MVKRPAEAGREQQRRLQQTAQPRRLEPSAAPPGPARVAPAAGSRRRPALVALPPEAAGSCRAASPDPRSRVSRVERRPVAEPGGSRAETAPIMRQGTRDPEFASGPFLRGAAVAAAPERSPPWAAPSPQQAAKQRQRPRLRLRRLPAERTPRQEAAMESNRGRRQSRAARQRAAAPWSAPAQG